MASITSFMLCDGVENIPFSPNIPRLNNPTLALRPKFIPGNFSFGVCVGISDMDMTQQNTLAFSIVSPEGEIIHQAGETTVSPCAEDTVLPQKFKGLIVAIDIRNMEVKTEGEYKFRIYLNSQIADEHIFPIYKGI